MAHPPKAGTAGQAAALLQPTHRPKDTTMNTANACCTRKNSATATVLELLQWAVKAQDPARDTSALATANATPA